VTTGPFLGADRNRQGVPDHDHDASEISGDAELMTVRAGRITGGTINGKTIILAGASGVIQSDDFVTGTSGWQIAGDGSAEFNDVLVRGDIESGNWDGTSPANLATVDTGATAGFYLDSSVGAAQFEGDIWLRGNLQASDDTDIVFGDDADATIGFISGTSALQVAGGSLLSLSATNVSLAAATTLNVGEPTTNLMNLSAEAISVEVPTEAGLGVNMLDDSLAVLFNEVEVARFTADAGNNLQGLAWTDWTPQFTNFSTVGGSTITARYVQIGQTVHCRLHIIVGTTPTVGDVRVSLPVAAASTGLTALTSPLGTATLLETGVANNSGLVVWVTTTTVGIRTFSTATAPDLRIAALSATVPFTWAGADEIHAEWTYEAA
jgi:hypothetical protein